MNYGALVDVLCLNCTKHIYYRGPLASSTPHSNSALSISSHSPLTVLLAFLVISPPPTQPSVCFCLFSICSHHMSMSSDLTLLNNPQKSIILPKVPCNSPVCLHVGRMCGVMYLQQSCFQIPGYVSRDIC